MELLSLLFDILDYKVFDECNFSFSYEDEGDPRMTQPFSKTGGVHGEGEFGKQQAGVWPRYGNLTGVGSSLHQRVNLVNFFLGELG